MTLVVYPHGIEKNAWIRYFLRRIYLNKNNLVAMIGPTGCLSGDTKLLGHSKTLEELYNFGNKYIDTYSMTKQNYPKKSNSEIIPSGIKEIYEIELENGKKIQATKEHKFFMIRKGKRIEVILSELKIGDKLVCYPENYVENYYYKAKSKAGEIRKLKHNQKKLCKKCNSLFYTNFGYDSCNKYCKKCRETQKEIRRIKNHKESIKRSDWYEWEDNLIRQFYYDMPKEELKGLLSLKNTWSSICHRAQRLGIKRKGILQWGSNAFTSKKNPMYNIEIRKKMIEKLRGRPTWNKGIHQWKDKQHPKGMLNRHHTLESKDKISKSTSGELCIHWLGGKSFEPYDIKFNRLFKRDIKNRDLNKCSLCNGKNKLTIHHIDYNKLNSNELNCITLCVNCHAKTNFKREYWKEYLSKIIEEKYVLLKN